MTMMYHLYRLQLFFCLCKSIYMEIIYNYSLSCSYLLPFSAHTSPRITHTNTRHANTQQKTQQKCRYWREYYIMIFFCKSRKNRSLGSSAFLRDFCLSRTIIVVDDFFAKKMRLRSLFETSFVRWGKGQCIVAVTQLLIYCCGALIQKLKGSN